MGLEWKRTAKAWALVFGIFIEHGANLNVLSKRQRRLPGHPRQSLLIAVERYFPDFLNGKGAEQRLVLKDKRPGGVEQDSSRMNNGGGVVEKGVEKGVQVKSGIRWMVSRFRV
jgi:hypothetical protein